MRPRLSELAADRLTYMIDAIAEGTLSDAWVTRVMHQARVPQRVKSKDAGAVDKVDRWLTDTSTATMKACLHDVSTARRCDPRLLALSRVMGVNAVALGILSKAVGGPAGVDVGLDQNDARQVSVKGDGVLDDIMVPLGTDVYWTGRAIYIRTGTIPDTVYAAACGRPVHEIVDHPELIGAGTLTGERDEQGGFDRLTLAPAPVMPWREAVASLDREAA